MRKLSALLSVAVLMGLAILFFSVKKPEAVRIDTAPATQINFIEDSWGEALKQAAAQHKYIFVDAYATWCGPCKMLKATTFKNAKAADFFNKNFVNVAIDMEKGQGPELASAWGMQAYPTLIIFDSAGNPVLGTVGYIGANDLIKFGQKALSKKPVPAH
ncbi:thioredoxin family protein [Mucilaginibacter jinjuensis]|uniref:Thioredoxin domain-containing protein n=1 Tax=Mucilaginibacter jinjuensis TaxID=1176721 RepID=A0ABY7T635_9SPHI|nr:thioredoxin domain-containing protein [Mucilaginibacter jinjuensis]WCT11836.1 thioredoxin domain-containing protein [Mucilaginibacter jinjuensis]